MVFAFLIYFLLHSNPFTHRIDVSLTRMMRISLSQDNYSWLLPSSTIRKQMYEWFEIHFFAASKLFSSEFVCACSSNACKSRKIDAVLSTDEITEWKNWSTYKTVTSFLIDRTIKNLKWATPQPFVRRQVLAIYSSRQLISWHKKPGFYW